MSWSAPQGWEAVIGLEVHAQLRTESKLFSSAPHRFGAEPNTQTTEVDLGMPGVLPVLNERAVELALRAALALGCELHPVSIFARKHYFYPDLPKGYQISQYEEPFATGGAVPVGSRSVPLVRIHMEEDAGKSIHDPAITGGGATHVDLNRAGVPLVEIVSQPELHTPEEAGAYLRSLRSILRWVEACDADMEKGNFRCDANVSVRRAGDSKLGTRTELKNLNSFRFVERAIAHEIERQVDVLESGKRVVQETRTWDDAKGRSATLRTKEQAEDYRYFPEPDLPPLRLEPAFVERVRAVLPELPAARRARWLSELGISEDDAVLLCGDRALADFFERAARIHGDARSIANWIKRSLLEHLKEGDRELAELPFGPEQLAALARLVDDGRVTPASGREIFAELASRGGDPAEIMRARGLEAVADTDELEALAREVLERNPAQLAQYRGGDAKLFNFFVGQIMKATRGKASPAAVQQVLRGLLERGVSAPATEAGFSIERLASAGTAELRFAGALRLGNAVGWLGRARELVAEPGALRFDLSGLQTLDGGAAVLLLQLADELGRAGRSVEWSGARGRVAQILELYREHRPPARVPPPRASALERLGADSLELAEGARGAFGMLGDTIVAGGAAILAPRSVPWREVARLMERSGADALPIVALITFLTGLVTAFQAAIQLHRVGADLFVADAVALSMTRELGPLMTAIIAAGRSGAAFAAELGTMRVSEEIDALHTIGLDPQRYLVLPRVLALVAMLPLLTLLADAIGIAGGLVVGAVSLDLVPIAYLAETRKALEPWDVLSGLLKALAFAAAIALVGCQRGLATRGGAEGVGRATTSAVVGSLFLIIALDAVFTVAFHVFDL